MYFCLGSGVFLHIFCIFGVRLTSFFFQSFLIVLSCFGFFSVLLSLFYSCIFLSCLLVLFLSFSSFDDENALQL